MGNGVAKLEVKKCLNCRYQYKSIEQKMWNLYVWIADLEDFIVGREPSSVCNIYISITLQKSKACINIQGNWSAVTGITN